METLVMSEISIQLNGDSRRIEGGMSVADLVRSLDLEPEKVAVERNRQIVTRSTLGDVTVEDGDQLEIVHFVGGG